MARHNRRGESMSSDRDDRGRRSRREGSKDAYGRSGKKRPRESERDSVDEEARRQAAAAALNADFSQLSGPSTGPDSLVIVPEHLRGVADCRVLRW